MLPRDAWQQAEVGRDAGSDVVELGAGDLLFFTTALTGASRTWASRSAAAHGASGARSRRLCRGAARRRDDPYVTSLMTRFVSARRVI